MNKLWMAGLGTLTVVIWSVAIVLVLPKEETPMSEEHAKIRIPGTLEENVDFAGITKKVNEWRSSEQGRTVFGEQVITDEWKKDAADNGRVSIDTVLRSLSSDDS